MYRNLSFGKDKKLISYLIILFFLLLTYSCDILSYSHEDNHFEFLSVEDIRVEYRIVDSLNTLSFNGELDTTSLDRYMILGMDPRNDQIIVRRCDRERLFGCLMYHNVFGLFYQNCNSTSCLELEGVSIIDHEGFAGYPRFIGCSPDTSK